MRDDAFYVSLYTHSEEYSNFITLLSCVSKDEFMCCIQCSFYQSIWPLKLKASRAAMTACASLVRFHNRNDTIKYFFEKT